MPRMGIGMPIVSETSEAAVLGVEDFVFLNDVSGELTPVDTSSRTNKLVQSQTFKTTWTAVRATIPNDLFEAPDNSLTAQVITASSSGNSNVFVNQVVATTSGETYTYSAHVKAAANGFSLLLFSDGSTVREVWFNAVTGASSNTSNVLTTSFDKMDDGWVRISFTFQATSTTSSSFLRIYSTSAAGGFGTGAAFQTGTELLYIWGAQLEEDSRPTAYIVTTNAVVNVATNELNDVSSVWDFDGTDIMLEVDPENEGAFEEATANLVTNGDFATNISGWTAKDSSISWSNGKILVDNSAGNGGGGPFQNLSLTTGTLYEATATMQLLTGSTNGVFTLFTSNSSGGSQTGVYSGSALVTGGAAVTETFTFTPGDGDVSIQFNADETNATFTIDNVTVKEYAITPLNV